MLHDILGHDHIQWHTQLIRHYTNLRTYYRTGLYYRFWPYYQISEVSIEHCNGCGWPTEDTYSSGHLVLSHFGACISSNVETILSWTCHVYGPFGFRTPFGTSFLLLIVILIFSLHGILILLHKCSNFQNSRKWDIFKSLFYRLKLSGIFYLFFLSSKVLKSASC